MKKFAFLLAAFTAQPALAIDTCLVGSWNVDADDIAHILGLQMGATAMYTGGRARMDIFPDGIANVYVTALTFNVVMPDIPPMDVKIDGFSEATMEAFENIWTLDGGDYALTGSADVLGQTMTIPFDSSTGMFGGGSGQYGCTDEDLIFEGDRADVQMPRHWMRIIPDSDL